MAGKTPTKKHHMLAVSHTTPVRIAIFIHTGLVIYRCRPAVVDYRSSRCVGKTRDGAHDPTLVGTHMPALSVMHGSRVGSGTQSDQKAQGQNRTHRIFSSPPATRTLVRPKAAPPIPRRDFTISYISASAPGRHVPVIRTIIRSRAARCGRYLLKLASQCRFQLALNRTALRF